MKLRFYLDTSGFARLDSLTSKSDMLASFLYDESRGKSSGKIWLEFISDCIKAPTESIRTNGNSHVIYFNNGKFTIENFYEENFLPETYESWQLIQSISAWVSYLEGEMGKGEFIMEIE
jgi:hypothetical protein